MDRLAGETGDLRRDAEVDDPMCCVSWQSSQALFDGQITCHIPVTVELRRHYDPLAFAQIVMAKHKRVYENVVGILVG